jgi:hypothetical protein
MGLKLSSVLRISESAWPAARAALIALVLGSSILAAVPTPGAFSRDLLDDPAVRGQLDRWVAILGAIGVATDQKRLGEAYAAYADTVRDVRETVLAPYFFVNDIAATRQGWALFATPDERPTRLVVRVKRGRHTRVLYRSGDFEHSARSELADLLEYRRVRALYNPSRFGPPATYAGFARWVSERVFREFPDARLVVVSLERSHTTLPGEAPDTAVSESDRLEFQRGGR